MAEHARQLSMDFSESPETLETYNRRNLVTKLFWLYRFEKNVDQWCNESKHGTSASSLARELLSELDCTSYEGFIALFLERFEDPYFHKSFVDESTEDYITLKEFIEKSLD